VIRLFRRREKDKADAAATLPEDLSRWRKALNRTKANLANAWQFATIGEVEVSAEFFDSLVGNVTSGQTRTFTRERWDPSTWPEQAEGVGMTEAPRGALAHWIRIKGRKIDNYQLVVPTTWNGSPRDPKGQRSAYEASLIGTPVANLDQPLEILRTVHSFDPCIACAVHLYDPDGKHLHRVRFY